MSWIGAAIGAGTLLSVLNNQQKSANEKAAMLANAEQIRYSPWTKAAVSTQGPTANSTLGAIANGGLQGGMTALLMKKQLGQNPQQAAVVAPQAGAPNYNGTLISDDPMNAWAALGTRA
jgi:hypothetical protein